MNAEQLVASHYAASARGDMDGMLAPMSPEIRWTEMAGSAYAGTYVGPQEILRNVFARIDAEWEGFEAYITDLHAAGDTVTGLGYYRGTHKATGKKLEARTAHVWRVADGQIVAFEQFTDTALLAAAETA